MDTKNIHSGLEMLKTGLILDKAEILKQTHNERRLIPILGRGSRC